MEMQKWAIIEQGGWQVLLPAPDIKQHLIGEFKNFVLTKVLTNCPCQPTINWLDMTITHNSFMNMSQVDKSLQDIFKT